MTDWTPGPWDIATRSGSVGLDIGPVDWSVAEVKWAPEPGRRDANARLIAAAPRMAAELEADDVGEVSWFDRRDVLLAEIRGEA